jgi:hypothetical protein
VKTIVKKELKIETKRHDFDNEFAYIETWHNTLLKDCYFAEKQFLWPDGTIKNGGEKLFFCNTPDLLEKEIKPINYTRFDNFDHLYFFDKNGIIVNIINK